MTLIKTFFKLIRERGKPDPSLKHGTIMRIIVNPGSGLVVGANESHAIENMKAWCQDHSWNDLHFERMEDMDKNGRYGFAVWRDSIPRWRKVGEGIRIKNSIHDVMMPGLPLSKVRYVGGNDQNIWDFPRLYIDGSSWVWCYSLLDDDESWDPDPS